MGTIGESRALRPGEGCVASKKDPPRPLPRPTLPQGDRAALVLDFADVYAREILPPWGFFGEFNG